MRLGLLCGAGLSAASGVPTFRGPQGLWKEHRPEELATPQAFARDPALVWEWYAWRRRKVRQARPNAAHHAITALCEAAGEAGIITQNVDGLQQRAGLPGHATLVEIHGSLWRTRCRECGDLRDDPGPGPTPGSELPRCGCGALVGPGVVWFGEALARSALDTAAHIAHHCDLFLVVGTSAVVQPAASFAALAARAGALVLDFNVEETPLAPLLHRHVPGPCEATLPLLPDLLGPAAD